MPSPKCYIKLSELTAMRSVAAEDNLLVLAKEKVCVRTHVL